MAYPFRDKLKLNEITLTALVWFFFFIEPLTDRGFDLADLLPHCSFIILYMAIVYGINYQIIPRYFYVGKYLKFLTGIAILLILGALIEENVLEKIFYPNTQGSGPFQLLDFSSVDFFDA